MKRFVFFRVHNPDFHRNVLFSVSMVIILLTGIGLVLQNGRTHRTKIENRAFQIMTGMVERYSRPEEFDPERWDHLVGFGLYDAAGIAVYRYGTAPEGLEESGDEAGMVSTTGNTVTMIRRTGVVPPIEGPGFMHGRRMVSPSSSEGRRRSRNTMPMHRPHVQFRQIHSVFIELDAASLLRQAWLETGAIIMLFSALLITVPLFYRNSRRLARYREREQKNAYLVQLGEAARTLAHEIKNPLGVIKVQCATLERSLPEAFRKNLAVIGEETDRLAVLTDRLRDFLRSGEGNPERLSVRGILEQYRVRYGDSLTVADRPEPDVTVVTDPDFLTQMLDNLVRNARDALAETGGLPELDCVYNGSAVRFRVLDRGSGVAADRQEHLFELFYTTKAQGSGIGLALVKRLAEASGGTAGYRPRHGGGSEFWIELPAGQPGEDENGND
ncbi:MAG TPA: HAMP domain-containing sensor histidine kinase [Treponemataceae bacterium]|nr:HAMP domain-containing sensor histidine kinase [Treponemataceae bacterium]HOS34595.1 HAMP domain-containing sensor histidine kinase [Treponemataceae bacterium]